MCWEVTSLMWSCGCLFQTGDVPELPNPFVRYCPNGFVRFNNTYRPRSCHELQQSENGGRVPWLCSKCYSLVMVMGNVSPRSDQQVKMTKALHHLLYAALYADGESLTQIRLITELRHGLQNGKAMHEVEGLIHNLRHEVMHEYLGAVWHQIVFRSLDGNMTAGLDPTSPSTVAAWQPRHWLLNADHITFDLDELLRITTPQSPSEADLIEFTDSTSTSLESSPALSVSTASTRSTASSPPATAITHGQSAATLIVHHIQDSLREAAHTRSKPSATPFETLHAEYIETVTLPGLATLLEEQHRLDEIFSDAALCYNLRIISDWECIGDFGGAEGAAAKTYVQEGLKPAVKLWKARYERIGSNEVTLSRRDGSHQGVRLKIIPDAITDYVWQHERAVAW